MMRIATMVLVLSGVLTACETGNLPVQGENLRVRVLDCEIHIPVDYMVNVNRMGEVAFYTSGIDSGRITVEELSALGEDPPSGFILKHSRKSGHLTIEQQTLDSMDFAIIRGLSQALLLSGSAVSLTDQIVDTCLESVSDEVLRVAARREEEGCKAELNVFEDLRPTLESASPQIVFVSGKIVGYRLYKIEPSSYLGTQGVADGDLLTHVCDVPIAETHAVSQPVCCASGRPIELTFERRGDKVIKVRILDAT